MSDGLCGSHAAFSVFVDDHMPMVTFYCILCYEDNQIWLSHSSDSLVPGGGVVTPSCTALFMYGSFDNVGVTGTARET